MKAVKTIQKYKCDFCKKRSIKSAMERHEKICFRNPNRYCDYCQNEGFTREVEEGYSYQLDCPYCGSFDKKKLKEIETREAKDKEENYKEDSEVVINPNDIPF